MPKTFVAPRCVCEAMIATIGDVKLAHGRTARADAAQSVKHLPDAKLLQAFASQAYPVMGTLQGTLCRFWEWSVPLKWWVQF